MELKISSYNCRGLPKDSKKMHLRQDICEVFNRSHVVALQETWYAKQNLEALNTLHKDYVGVGVATVDETQNLYQGHYPGGVAIFWRKELSRFIKKLEFNTNWGVAIEISVGSSNFTLLNIYMPYQHAQNKERYFENLWTINAFVETIQNTSFMIIGDWNANLSDTGNSLFRNMMLDFCCENNLLISSKSLLPPNSYSFVSYREDNMVKS